MAFEAANARDVIVKYCQARLRTPTVAIARYCELLEHSIARALLEAPGDRDLLDLKEPGAVIRRANDELSQALADLGAGVTEAADEAALMEELRSRLGNAINKVRNAAELVADMAEDIPGGRRIARDAADLVAESERAESILRAVDPANPVVENRMAYFRILRTSTQALRLDAEEKIGRGRILVIDGDPSTGELMRRLIERFDCECVLVQTGEEAFAQLKRGRIDLIISELILSDMMALDILRRLQDMDDDTPLIVASNVEHEDLMVSCIAMGARDYLPNPPPTMLLKARIKPALERKFLADRSRDLLYSILPEHIAREWSTKGTRIFADRHDAAILFTDIVGFTAMMRDQAPDNVVFFLHDVFADIDALIQKRGVQKIKTIGDAYMIASGLEDPERTPFEKTAPLAALALDLAGEVGERLKGLCELAGLPPLRFRVGMHFGPVVAGVIGQERPAYDIWGDTVNTASRMESHGAPGRVHVSEVVRDILADAYAFEQPQPIEIKSLGLTQTYFLTGPR